MVMVIYIVSFIDKIEIIKINNELAGASTGNILSWSIYVKPTSIIDKLSSELICFDKAYTAATILISTLYFGFIKPARTCSAPAHHPRQPRHPTLYSSPRSRSLSARKRRHPECSIYCCPVFPARHQLRQRVGGLLKASASRFSGTPV